MMEEQKWLAMTDTNTLKLHHTMLGTNLPFFPIPLFLFWIFCNKTIISFLTAKVLFILLSKVILYFRKHWFQSAARPCSHFWCLGITINLFFSTFFLLINSGGFFLVFGNLFLLFFFSCVLCRFRRSWNTSLGNFVCLFLPFIGFLLWFFSFIIRSVLCNI